VCIHLYLSPLVIMVIAFSKMVPFSLFLYSSSPNSRVSYAGIQHRPYSPLCFPPLVIPMDAVMPSVSAFALGQIGSSLRSTSISRFATAFFLLCFLTRMSPCTSLELFKSYRKSCAPLLIKSFFLFSNSRGFLSSTKFHRSETLPSLFLFCGAISPASLFFKKSGLVTRSRM